MNRQPTGKGIEWCTHTWNPIAGCQHACRWQMPDGTIAVCYAETVAENVAQAAYPHGFSHHYYKPAKLTEPLREKVTARIFIDSMSDLMGAWVKDDEIEAVIDVMRRAHWHTFILLTKNAPRLLKFTFPANVWVLVSSPPDWMFGKRLTAHQQARMLARSLDVLTQMKKKGQASVIGMSAEPLSWNIAPFLSAMDTPLDWIIIGAASAGRRYFPPDPAHVEALHLLCDTVGTPVFHKGNLRSFVDLVRQDYP